MDVAVNQFLPFVPILILVGGGYAGYVKIRTYMVAKLKEHTKEIEENKKEANSKITHLDTIKQSAVVCDNFRKEMKEDIRNITGILQVMQTTSTQTQVSIANIEGKLNGKTIS